ncbi:hypothetical protein [uncultured Lactococcus sp.]|uniref:hypothetical protein n=1 Tax=uncultured Lactococcus sp. TaxID=167973 RepID=UPI0027DB08F6|nr:hypothetical protein [uncultured Lactococcus sp.]
MELEYIEKALVEQEEEEVQLILDFLKLTKPSFYQYLGVLREKAHKYDALIKEAQDEEI